MIYQKIIPRSQQHGQTFTGDGAIARPAVYSTAKAILLIVLHVPLLHALPTRYSLLHVRTQDKDEAMPSDSPTLWIYLLVAIALVLLGGAFAGLTIALMGQVQPFLTLVTMILTAPG